MLDELRWREAGADDVAALLSLIVAAYRTSAGWTSEAHLVEGERITPEQLRRRIAAEDGCVMVVPAGDGLLACCEVSDLGGGAASFGMFAVDPARQAGGVGRRLLACARELAIERFAAHTLEIHVISAQAALIAWYERLGFAATGESIPFPDDGRDRALVPGLRFIVMRAPTRREPYALSWSGGKDSALALSALTAVDGHPPVALITTVTADYERVSMHGVRRELLVRQAGAAGLALVEVRIPAAASNEIYERRMAQALARPPLHAIEAVAFGDLFLADIRAYREQRCADAGLRARFPLWGRDTRALATRFLELGFRARIACLDPRRLPARFAGREYDERLLSELPEGVDPCGENGEFHTFVYDGPVFASPIPVRPGDVHEREGFVFADLLPA